MIDNSSGAPCVMSCLTVFTKSMKVASERRSVERAPLNIMGRARPEHSFGDDWLFDDLVKKLGDMALGAKEIQVTIDLRAINGVINELNPSPK